MGYSHSEIARRYAKGFKTGKGKRMFIDGDTIYSHGYHYPIARRIGPGVYVINSNTYSVSTSRHVREVSRALSRAGAILHTAPDCNPDLIYTDTITRLDEAASKFLRAKNYHMQSWWDSQIRRFYTEWQKSADKFGLHTLERDLKIESLANSDAVCIKRLELSLKGGD